MSRNSIKTRLLVLSAIILLLTLAGSMVVANLAFTKTIEASAYDVLERHAAYLAMEMQQSGNHIAYPLLERYAEANRIRITLIAVDGTVVYDSSYDIADLDNHGSRSEVVQALSGGSGLTQRTSTTENLPVLYWAVRLDGSTTAAVLRVSKLLSEMRSYEATYRTYSLVGLALLLLVCTIITFIAINRFTRPLDAITKTAALHAAGNLDARVHVDAPVELANLAHTINTMAVQLTSRISQVEGERRQYSTILDSMTEGILYIDPHLIILEANQAAAKLLLDETMPGGNLQGLRLLQVTGASEVLGACSACLADGVGQELEIAHFGHLFGDSAMLMGKRATSMLRITITRMNPSVEGQQADGIVMTINDITGLKRLEAVRKEFVANVSHELKTPITAITGFTDALLDGHNQLDDAMISHFLGIIKRQAVRMQHIVDDLLLLSSLEQDGSGFIRTWSTVEQIINDAKEAYGYKEQEKGSTVTVHIDNPDDLPVFTNGMLVVQALANLVINAITYSDNGSEIAIKVEVTDSLVTFCVVDHGYGIPKEVQERIFERFYRVDKARSRRQGGTGLGLSIVKHIVQVHKGTIKVDSTEGIGSTFTMVFPRTGNELDHIQQRSDTLYGRQ